MLVSEAPCAQAIIEIPLRPNVPKSFPATPGVWRIFSPTIATVANPPSACMGNIEPVSISLANSLFKTLTASFASALRTPIDVEFSEEACETINAEIPPVVRAVKIRWFTPMTPTIERPVTVISVVSLILEIPFIGLKSLAIFCLIIVPGLLGLNVFFTLMGIFLMHTG